MGKLPDYMILGMPRCGTTSMYNYIGEHPQACIARADRPKQEIHFFDYDQNYKKGLGWYKSWFNQPDGIICGDASPTYLHCKKATERIKQHCPEAKFIVMLRDPVDRAYSDYHKMRVNKHERISFEKAIKLEETRLRADLPGRNYYMSNRHLFGYYDRSNYIPHMARWLDAFPREQFLIISSETFYGAPEVVMPHVWEHLGLPHHTLRQRRRWQHVNYPPMKSDMRVILSAMLTHARKMKESLCTI